METEYADEIGAIDSRGIARFQRTSRRLCKTDSVPCRFTRNGFPDLSCVLLAEGHHGRAVIEAPDRRLFLWSEEDTARALADLAQRRWVRFGYRGGRTVILETIRVPEVDT